MDFEKYGITGILIAGIIWMAIFIKGLMKDHTEERDQWQRRQEQQNDDHNRSLNKNTEVLSELTTLIKSMRK